MAKMIGLDGKANMKRFAELGADIYVTEFDVNRTDIPGMQDNRKY